MNHWLDKINEANRESDRTLRLLIIVAGVAFVLVAILSLFKSP